MSQDKISDALNQIMNAKTAGKKEVKINHISKPLINLFELMKKGKYINFEVFDKEENSKKPFVNVKILKLNECKAIKPRYFVQVKDIEKYLRRFLVSRNFGFLIISTNKGLLNQDEALEKKIGGSLIAYFY